MPGKLFSTISTIFAVGLHLELDDLYPDIDIVQTNIDRGYVNIGTLYLSIDGLSLNKKKSLSPHRQSLC